MDDTSPDWGFLARPALPPRGKPTRDQNVSGIACRYAQGREVPIVRIMRSEVAPPHIDMADRYRHHHHREGIERVGDEAERHPVAIADAGHCQVGGGAYQGAVAA